METTERESRKDGVKLLRKYIRLQEIGLSFVLSWPVAMILAEMYGFAHLIPVISVLLIVAGVAIFSIGHIGRQELRNKDNEHS